jgi:hypothetical protein
MEITSSHGLRLVATLCVAAGLSAPVYAVNFGDMMNPGSWFGGNRDTDDRRYGRDVPPPGYYGAPAYGYGAPYGYPQGGAAPYAYGQPAAPAATPASPYGAPAASAPAAPKADDSEARIRELEQRIKELEAARQPPAYAPASPSAGVPQTSPGYAPLPPAAGSPQTSPAYVPPPPAADAAQAPVMRGDTAGHNFRPMGQN